MDADGRRGARQPVSSGRSASAGGLQVAAELLGQREDQRLLGGEHGPRVGVATLGEVVQDAVDEVKNTAVESKQAVADTVRDGVDATTSTAQEATASIKEQASS